MKGLVGDAAREHCCPVACSYRVEAVRHHLDVLLAFERAGEMAGQAYTTPALDRFGSCPTGDGRTAMIDVGRVVEQLRADGTEITAEAVSARLCPWSSTTDACD